MITASGEPLISSISSSHTGRRRGARHDLAVVECQLDDTLRRAQAAAAPADVGAVQALQRRRPGLAQHREQALAGGRAGMQRRIGRGVGRAGRRQAHVVLGAREAVGAVGLQRLHPAPALAPHAQGDAGAGQRAIGRVEVRRLQALPLRRHGLAAGDFGIDGIPACRRHLQLQLDLVHDPDLPLVFASPTFSARPWVFSMTPSARPAPARRRTHWTQPCSHATPR